jgi:hypothetical protein
MGTVTGGMCLDGLEQHNYKRTHPDVNESLVLKNESNL